MLSFEALFGKPPKWLKEPCGSFRVDTNTGIMYYGCGENSNTHGEHEEYFLAHQDGKIVDDCKCINCLSRRAGFLIGGEEK